MASRMSLHAECPGASARKALTRMLTSARSIVHDFEQARGVGEVDARAKAAPVEDRQFEVLPRRLGASLQHRPHRVFDQAGECDSVGCRGHLRLPQQVVVQVDGRSHAAKHTAFASMCKRSGYRSAPPCPPRTPTAGSSSTWPALTACPTKIWRSSPPKIIWSDEPEEHIARHSVIPREVDHAVNARPIWTTPGRNGTTLVYCTTSCRPVLARCPGRGARRYMAGRHGPGLDRFREAHVPPEGTLTMAKNRQEQLAELREHYDTHDTSADM